MNGRFTPTGNRITYTMEENRSKYGLIAKAVLTPSEIFKLHQVSEKTKIVECAINICNLGAADAHVRLWFSHDNHPSDVDVVEPYIKIKPNEVFIRQTFWISQNEIVYIMSDQPNVVVRLDGYDQRRF